MRAESAPSPCAKRSVATSRSRARTRLKATRCAARSNSLRGPFIARIVGGHLEVQDAADVEAGVVGGKVRASNLSGAARIGKVGGKLALDGIAGDVAVGFVGGNARVAKVGGALSLEEVDRKS